MLRITRTELLSLIWSKSATKLGEELGVSDVAIAKWCKKMEVPKPPRGYWAKLQAGKVVPQRPKLKRLTREGVSFITINLQSTTPKKDSPKCLRIEVVPGSLDEPHWLVKVTRNGLRRGKTDYRKIVHSKNRKQLDVQVSRSQVDRACRVFDSLIKTLEKDGITVCLKDDKESRATQVEIDGYKIEIGIDEKIQRTEKKQTTNEYYWGDDRFIFTPTGKLSIVVRSWSRSVRSTWNDGKIQRVENCIASVITSLRHLADLLHKEELKHLEWEREWELERQARRKREIEEYKGKLVLGHMEQWKTARDLSSFLDDLQTKACDTPGLNEYIAWAREYAQAINPVFWPEHLVFDDETIEEDAPHSYR